MNVEIRPMHNGFMVWWEENKEAARYIVNLFICKKKNVSLNTEKGILKDKKIEIYKKLCEIEKDRRTFYHSFMDLAVIDHYYTASTGTGIACRCVHNTGLTYCVEVVAEDRDGKVLSVGDKVYCNVKEDE